MLRFATKPDHVFLALLVDAIDLMVDNLHLEGDPFEQQDALECLLPKSATLFDADTARSQLYSLGAALRAPELLQPTDYHWLLLYEVLHDYCAGFDAMPGGVLTENYGIDHLDFGALIDLYFWDTDFLDSHIPLLPLETRQRLDISPETFGLTAGMKPHREELVLKVCEAEAVKEFDADGAVVLLLGSTTYPSCPDLQAN